MEDKKLGRRAFLKLVVASATATGLSHFRFLNPGSGVVLANPCEVPGVDPDVCDPGATDFDLCAPGWDPDECDPAVPGDPDICAPGFDPDVCAPPDEPDVCDPGNGEPDESPTAVTLASFTAASDGNAIRVMWETASEIDNLGFQLYRANSADGPASQLNESLIPAKAPGSPVGATYSFRDEEVEPGVTYYYWLDDVDVYGVATRHGPVSAEASPLRRLLPVRPRHTPGRPKFRGQ